MHNVMTAIYRDAKKVITKIESAFADVKLGGGIGILEAYAIDCYATDNKRAKYRERDERENWKRISDEQIESHGSSLNFMDDDGIRFCLPAYMRFSLVNYKSACESVDAPIYSLEQCCSPAESGVEIFTVAQNYAIASYLEYVVIELGNELDEVCASRALELFWREYLS